MTTVIAIFVLSLAFSLFLTPHVGSLAKRFQILDKPSARKIHSRPIPHVGGVSIYLAFFLPFVASLLFSSRVTALVDLDSQMIALVLGASLAFGLGLWDDIRGFSPYTKLQIQVLAALIAYVGGIHIKIVALPGVPGWSLGWFSLPVTIFWFLLVINAINLIDGLDGLAAGVSFFVSIVLLVLCVTTGRFLVAMGLAALGGASLGFLRYNFNPASIFMGDSGSYFLGYMLAALSILGSIKSQATVAILIPIIALGLPLMDTMIAPIRRLIIGNGPFLPDKDHLHHRLLQCGLTHRRAVVLLYGVNLLLGLMALSLVHARDDRAALILLLLGAGAFFGIRKLGYMEFLAADKLIERVRILTDELGLQRYIHTSSSWQTAISDSSGLKELWDRVVAAARHLGFEYSELKLEEKHTTAAGAQDCLWQFSSGGVDREALDSKEMWYVSLPLVYHDHPFGSLLLAKNTRVSPLAPSVLRRAEHLRHTLVETLMRLAQPGQLELPVSG